MPELPEVETVVRALNKSIKGKIFKDVFVFHKNIIEGDEKTFINNIKGKKINEIRRRGKFLIFDLTGKNVMVAHLRMEGKFIPAKSIKDKTQYARVIFTFKDGTILNFDDSRCFGLLTLRDKQNYQDVLPLSKVGVEAIDPKLDINKVYQVIHASKRNIKETLLDQSIVSGLGNIYVDETLFKAKISPLSKAYRLSKSEIERILKCAKETLLLAIKYNGTTVSTFYWERGHTGGFQKYLKAYGRKGDECEYCHRPLVKIKVGGRGTTYCPKCQKLKTDRYVLGITGPTSVGKSLALNEFKKLGYHIYSSDEAVNKLYLDKNFKALLKKTFKKTSKNEIRALIKKDPNKIVLLNKLIHPLIKKDIKAFIENNHGNLAIEVPLLFQTGMDELMDETLLILSKQNRAFIKQRGAQGLTQLKLNEKVDYLHYRNQATYIIHNDASLGSYLKQIRAIAH